MALEAYYTTGYGIPFPSGKTVRTIKGRTIQGIAKRYAELCRERPDIRLRQRGMTPDSKGRYRQEQSIIRVFDTSTSKYRLVGWIRPDGSYVQGPTYRAKTKNPCNPCSNPYGVENPLRHFPSLKGRGRPAHKRKFDMVTRLVNGDIYQKTFTDTVRNAQARARRRMLTPHKGVKVAEVILDDGR